MPDNQASHVERPRFVTLDDPRRFTVKSAGVEATKSVGDDGVERMVLRGTASSNVEDRGGDTLDAVAQAKMVDQARGLTMWLNHSYEVPEDILGTCTTANLESAKDKSGENCIDLNIEVQIDPENPRAVKSWRHVEGGTRLAFSIGGIFLDFDWNNPDDWMDWSVTVHDVELLEISLVGIPANPRAYTKAFGYMTKGLRAHAAVGAEAFDAHERTPEARAAIKRALLAGTPGSRMVESKGIIVPAHIAAKKSADETAAALVDAEDVTDVAALIDGKDAAGAATATTSTETSAANAPANAAADATGTDGQGAAAAAGAAPASSPEATAGGVAATPTAPAADAASAAGAEPVVEAVSVPQDAAVADAAVQADPVVETAAAAAHDPVAPAPEQLAAAGVQTKGASATPALETKEVDDPEELTGEQMASIVGAMKSLRSASVHGLCLEAMGHVKGAHSALKALLPDDYDFPEDAVLPDDPDMPTVDKCAKAFTVTVQLDEKQVEELRAKWAAEMQSAGIIAAPDMQQKSASLASEIAESEKKRDALTIEVKDLEEKLARLRATPTGRRSANPIGSNPNGSEPVVPVEAYYESSATLERKLGIAMVSGSDGRSRVL